MNKIMFSIVNMVMFYVYWYLCLLGPSKENYYFGPIIGLLYFCFHFIVVDKKINDFKIFVLCGFLGLFFESTLHYSGFIIYKGILINNFNIIPFWVLILWFGFGLTLLHSFKWLLKRNILSSIVVALITPLIYISAHKIGSITLVYSLAYSYIILAVSWIFIFFFINIIVNRYVLD
ncbi:MAG: hypothetical protein CMG66_00225 [Candidatus Marinimicrobia bacterium]|nr:hypothetical protein [Candidatus Neomarinimicrobiota bacterium]|tara:strand:+ start:3601 stop:4128 length:528 start_codon:yes stop_codon:yes gene_type:complete